MAVWKNLVGPAAVKGIDGVDLHRLILAEAEIICHLNFQDFLGYFFPSYGHHRLWQYGSFLPGDR